MKRTCAGCGQFEGLEHFSTGCPPGKVTILNDDDSGKNGHPEDLGPYSAPTMKCCGVLAGRPHTDKCLSFPPKSPRAGVNRETIRLHVGAVLAGVLLQQARECYQAIDVTKLEGAEGLTATAAELVRLASIFKNGKFHELHATSTDR